MKVIRAKYPGKCRRCGNKIGPGDLIVWGGRGRTWHYVCKKISKKDAEYQEEAETGVLVQLEFDNLRR